MSGPVYERKPSDADGFPEQIAHYIRSLIEAEWAIVEQACEAAIQGGEHGVLIWRNREGLLLHACVSEAVPYGYQHVHVLDRPTCDLLALKPLVSPVLPPSPSGGV